MNDVKYKNKDWTFADYCPERGDILIAQLVHECNAEPFMWLGDVWYCLSDGKRLIEPKPWLCSAKYHCHGIFRDNKIEVVCGERVR